MSKESGEKKVVRTGPQREGSAGFLRMLAFIAAMGARGQDLRMPGFPGSGRSRRSNSHTGGAFGGGARTGRDGKRFMRVGGYKFIKGIGLRGYL